MARGFIYPLKKSFFFKPTFLLFFFILWPLPGNVLANQPFGNFSNSHDFRLKAKVIAMVEPETVHPGDRVTLLVRVTLARGWHIYSLEPQGNGESLETKLTLATDNLEPLEAWKEPEPEITLDKAVNKVVKTHKGYVVFHREFMVGKDLNPGEYPLPGKIVFRTCNNRICSMPIKVDFMARFRVIPG